MLSDILATYMFFPAVSETTDLYMVSEYNVSTVTSHICDDDHLYTYLFFETEMPFHYSVSARSAATMFKIQSGG